MRTLAVLAIFLLSRASPLYAKAVIYPVAPELRSDQFLITIGGQESPVAHAATNYYFVNVALKGKAQISITAGKEGYWDRGVEVQPWRWGIRPTIKGRTITFSIAEPMKLSISRPGDHAAGSDMLFLFANAPEVDSPKQGGARVHYYGPGAYHENIDAKSGDTIYLAPGAVIFGALNLWGVENVKVFGRGVIVYDGPQNPNNDQGWMHKPNWHVIVMDHARNVQISGITCVVRSRTWMIQMLASRHITFDNVKVMGGCPGNANQDGMDWLGGGDTVIRDSFFRASDDIFALYGNWLGYDAEALTTPGETVDNILIENSVLSTSISNVVRVSWPQKVFDSHHFTMRNSDVIHMGMGGCKIPFGLLEIWDDPAGQGQHSDYSFENIRLENWYSLLQLRPGSSSIRGVKLKDVWALETPSLVPSVLSGDVSGVGLQNVSISGQVVRQDENLPLTVESAASAPAYSRGDGPHAAFHVDPGVVKPRTQVTFDASGSAGTIRNFAWTFGDGSRAQGRVVRHKFADANGTLMDHSGRFRVLLKVTGSSGQEDWTAQSVVVSNDYAPALTDSHENAALHYRYYEGAGLTLADLARLTPAVTGTTSAVTVANRKRPEDYAFIFDGTFDVPVDGGYTFLLLANDAAELHIDSHLIAASPAPKSQVCGMTGNMVQVTTGSLGLAAGKHKLHAAVTHSTGPDDFAIKWQGPGRPLSDFPLSPAGLH